MRVQYDLTEQKLISFRELIEQSSNEGEIEVTDDGIVTFHTDGSRAIELMTTWARKGFVTDLTTHLLDLDFD